MPIVYRSQAHDDQGIKGDQEVEAMNRVGDGPEIISKALHRWAYENGVTLRFSRPGKQPDNAFVKSFNGRFRDECLNAHWLFTMADARAKIEAWRHDYNKSGLHTSLG